MATREELSERVAKMETQVSRIQEDISRLDSEVDVQQQEVRKYIDVRAKELFKICLHEHDESVLKISNLGVYFNYLGGN